jgi:hypothetical protein
LNTLNSVKHLYKLWARTCKRWIFRNSYVMAY